MNDAAASSTVWPAVRRLVAGRQNLLWTDGREGYLPVVLENQVLVVLPHRIGDAQTFFGCEDHAAEAFVDA